MNSVSAALADRQKAAPTALSGGSLQFYEPRCHNRRARSFHVVPVQAGCRLGFSALVSGFTQKKKRECPAHAPRLYRV